MPEETPIEQPIEQPIETPTEEPPIEENITKEIPEQIKKEKFDDICDETCILELNQTEYTLVLEVDSGTTLNLKKIIYTIKKEEAGNITEKLKENITEEIIIPAENITTNITIANITEIQYENIQEDKEIQAVIDSISYDNETGTLTAIFHHESGKTEPIVIISDESLDYSLSANESAADENITLIVENWNPSEYFEIKIGQHSQIIGIGEIPEYDVNAEVKDAQGNSVNVTVEFEKPVSKEIKNEIKGKAQSEKVQKGKYDINIIPEEGEIKEIVINDINVNGSIDNLISIDTNLSIEGYSQAYAIDPTVMSEFTSANVTVTAQGSELYKCKNWNFTEQNCFGEWIKLMDITPGQDYTFTLTAEDPAFGENATGTPNDGLAFFMSDSFGGGDRGADGGAFDECPIQLNDYGNTSEKCLTWDCNGWTNGAVNTQPYYCSGGWQCTTFNGVTCAEYTCAGWTASGTNRDLKYCSGIWNCSSWTGNICDNWQCSTWSLGAVDSDYYCSGIWDCSSWNGNLCGGWNCTVFSNTAGAKTDNYCSGLWDCTLWNGNACDNWNCTARTSGTAQKDMYCSGGWNCSSFNGNYCDNWGCNGWTTGATAEYDYYCDRWNCSNFDSAKSCTRWDCLQWLNSGATDKDAYCSGNWDCTSWTLANDYQNPIVSLVRPANGYTELDTQNVTFTYNVTDDSSILNCTFYLTDSNNEVTSYTNTTIAKNVNQTFKINFDYNGDYRWNISCTDSQGNKGWGENRNLTLNIAGIQAALNKYNLTAWFFEDAGVQGNRSDDILLSVYNSSQEFAVNVYANYNSGTSVANISADPSKLYRAVFKIDPNGDWDFKGDLSASPATFYLASSYPFSNADNNNSIAEIIIPNNFNKGQPVGCSDRIDAYFGMNNFTAWNPSSNSNPAIYAEAFYLNITGAPYYLISYDSGATCDVDDIGFPGQLGKVQGINNNTAYIEVWFKLDDEFNSTASNVWWFRESNKKVWFNVTTNFVRTDSSPPVINLTAPANSSQDSDGAITFQYNVSDESSVSNCKLILNGAVDQTSSSITKGQINQFTKSSLANGDYNWKINCTDVYNYQGASETRYFTVSLPQNYTNATIIINETIRDSSGSPVSAKIEFIDTGSGQTDYNSTSGTTNNISSGTFNIKITVQNLSVNTITFVGANITGNVTDIVDLSVSNGTGKLGQIYGINPLLNYPYSYINVTATAASNVKDLLKCPNWNFTSNTCIDGRWKRIRNIVSGQNYTFTLLNSTDPGFGESNETILVLDKDDYLENYTETESGTERVNVSINVNNHTIKKIYVYEYNKTSSDNEIRIDKPSNASWYQMYAVDPTSLNSTNMIITVTNKANALYKCANWSMAYQSCNGNNWEFFTALDAGQSYNLTLTQGDPGFGETNISTYILHNESDSQYSAYKQMKNVSADIASVQSESVPTDNTGLYCWNSKWIAPNQTAGISVNGTWQFSIYTWSTVDGVAYIQSRIFKYNSTSPNEYNITKTQSTTDIMQKNSQTISSWGINISNGQYTNLSAGERVGIQLCANITTAKGGGLLYTRIEQTTSSSVRFPTTTIVDYYPIWSNNQTSIVSNYSSTPSLFNITWTDDVGVSNVYFESNYSGVSANYTMNRISGGVTNGVYHYNATLPAGTFYWKSYANDTANQLNSSSSWIFTINKTSSQANLTLNGTKSNITIVQFNSINLSCSRIAGEGNIYLYNNGSLINSGISISNLTAFNIAGLLNITCLYPATQNYTSSFETYYVNVTPFVDSIPPTWSNNKTNANSSTKYGNNVYFNVTLNDNAAGGYYILAYDNGSGVFVNGSAVVWNNQEISASKTIIAIRGQTVKWYFWFNDSSGNSNQTDIWQFIVANTPPTATDVAIVPSTAYTDNDLYCNYTYSDTDKDAESGTSFNWYKNNASQNINSQTLDNENTTKGENWKCQVTPKDIFDFGNSVNSSVVIIQNSAPNLIANIADQSWQQDTNKTDAFDLDDYFSDADNDALSYASFGIVNITVTINSTTHVASFSQPAGWTGTEYITFIANDSEAVAYSNNITLTVTTAPSPPSAGPRRCNPDWQCSGWSECANGQQTRTCSDLENCGTSSGKPAESQLCAVVLPVIITPTPTPAPPTAAPEITPEGFVTIRGEGIKAEAPKMLAVSSLKDVQTSMTIMNTLDRPLQNVEVAIEAPKPDIYPQQIHPYPKIGWSPAIATLIGGIGVRDLADYDSLLSWRITPVHYDSIPPGETIDIPLKMTPPVFNENTETVELEILENGKVILKYTMPVKLTYEKFFTYVDTKQDPKIKDIFIGFDNTQEAKKEKVTIEFSINKGSKTLNIDYLGPYTVEADSKFLLGQEYQIAERLAKQQGLTLKLKMFEKDKLIKETETAF